MFSAALHNIDARCLDAGMSQYVRKFGQILFNIVESPGEQMPEIDLVLNNGSKYAHKGHVASISAIISETTGAVQARAEFQNPDRMLFSGSNGAVVFPDEYKDVIVIPQEATFQLQDQIFVYKVVDGKTQSARITVVPKNNGTEYIVLSGLEVGDKIVASGAGLLREGMTITEKSAAADAEVTE